MPHQIYASKWAHIQHDVSVYNNFSSVHFSDRLHRKYTIAQLLLMIGFSPLHIVN